MRRQHCVSTDIDYAMGRDMLRAFMDRVHQDLTQYLRESRTGLVRTWTGRSQRVGGNLSMHQGPGSAALEGVGHIVAAIPPGSAGSMKSRSRIAGEGDEQLAGLNAAGVDA